MIWDRWRRRLHHGVPLPPLDPFEDLLEHAPVMALLVDRGQQVLAANEAARKFFSIDTGNLPASLIEVTREASLPGLLVSGWPEAESRLVHHRKVVRSTLVPGPRSGDTLLFISDVTELRRLETVRREFVANLVHELKTPLTSIRLAAESMTTEPPPEQRRRFAERVVQEADALARVIDNLRQLAEIEGEGAQVDRTRFPLEELIQESAERLRPDRPLRVSVTPELVVETDRAKLGQVLGNLLANAAKFSPPGSPIDVEAELADGEVRVSVRDRGPGISPEHWERVFERFYKVDRARSRATGGSGLGLAIAKHLMMVLGGRIWTQAAREGGQVFTLTLPQVRDNDHITNP
jgi:two-component system, OmpR family, phosphate regulon sensor histidine kinase PhoR